MLGPIVEKLDKIPEVSLVIINCLMAAFVLLAHGGSLAIDISNGGVDLRNVWPIVFISLPLSIFVLFTSVIGFIKKNLLRRLLVFHSIILLIGALFCVAYAFELLLNGLPNDKQFVWSVGLLTFFCVYPVYISRRILLEKYCNKNAFVKYSHVLIFLFVLFWDISIYTKAKNETEINTLGNKSQAENPEEWLQQLKEKNMVKE